MIYRVKKERERERCGTLSILSAFHVFTLCFSSATSRPQDVGRTPGGCAGHDDAEDARRAAARWHFGAWVIPTARAAPRRSVKTARWVPNQTIGFGEGRSRPLQQDSGPFVRVAFGRSKTPRLSRFFRLRGPEELQFRRSRHRGRLQFLRRSP